MHKLTKEPEKELKDELRKMVAKNVLPMSIQAAVSSLIKQPFILSHPLSILDGHLMDAISNLVNGLLNLSHTEVIEFGERYNLPDVKDINSDSLLAVLLIKLQHATSQEEIKRILLEDPLWI